MDGPFDATTLGHPWPCENLFEVEQAAAKIIRKDELLPCLVVLYPVFGLEEKTPRMIMCLNESVVVLSSCNQQAAFQLNTFHNENYTLQPSQSKQDKVVGALPYLFLDPGLDRGLISKDDFHLKRVKNINHCECWVPWISHSTLFSVKLLWRTDLYKEKHANGNSGAQCQA